MGRSVMTHSKAEAIAYIEFSQDDYDFFEDEILWYQDRIKELFPSMCSADHWDGNELHVIAENNLAFVTISEYCGLVAFCLVPKDCDWPDCWRENLAGPWCGRAAGKFCSIGTLSKVGTFSNGESVFKRKAIS